MPRLPQENNQPSAQIRPITPPLPRKSSCPMPPLEPATGETSVDLKIKTALDGVEKTYLPKDLSDSKIIAVTLDGLKEPAYLYVDNNGTPSKLVANDILRKEID